MAAAAVHIIRDPAQASSLLRQPRVAMLRLLAEPDSAAGVARRLELPRQQVNYHLRELESHGLLEHVETRRKGNCLERVVRATAVTYLISPEALGALGQSGAERRDRFSASWLVALAARAVRELAVLGHRAGRAGKRLPTLALDTEIRFRSAEERHAFAEELTGRVTSLAARYHDEHAPGGRLFRLFAGVYPAITRHEDDRGEAARLE